MGHLARVAPSAAFCSLPARPSGALAACWTVRPGCWLPFTWLNGCRLAHRATGGRASRCARPGEVAARRPQGLPAAASLGLKFHSHPPGPQGPRQATPPAGRRHHSAVGQPSLRAAVDFVAAPSSPRCVFELCSRHDPRRRLSCPHACRHACRHAHAASALTPRSARRPPTRFLPPYLPPLVMPAGASTEAARAVRGRGRRRAADDAGDDQARSGGAGARRGSGGPRVGPHAPPAAPPHLRCTPWLLGVTRPPGSPRACVKVIFLSFEWSESVVTFDPSYFWDMCTGFG